MKLWNKIGFFLVTLLFCACNEEDIVSQPAGGLDEERTVLSISMDNLLAVNMNSRGQNINTVLSSLNDLNIRIHENNTVNIYCDKDGKISVNGKNPGQTFIIKDDWVTPSDGHKNWIDVVRVHCNDIAAAHVKKIEVIANAGKDLRNEQWDKYRETGDVNLQKAVPYCMMYGSKEIKNPLVDSTPYDHESDKGARNCRKFSISLKRTRAMLSVMMDGKNLREGVTITPKKVSLKNVPSSCLLTATNRISDPSTSTIKSYQPSEVGLSGSLKKGGVLGVHAQKNATTQKYEAPNGFCPMFLYENNQGVNNKITNQVTKWPEGCESIAEVKKNTTHSYIEIEADYKYEDKGVLKNSGTIVYRFFLGADIVKSFEVVRNTYYRLTLNLKDFGGAKEDGKVDKNNQLIVNNEDVSWRVDLSVRDWGFEKDAYDFDAHAVLSEVHVLGQGWKLVGFKASESGIDRASSWIRFSSANYGTAGFAEPNDKNIQGENGKIVAYIQPLMQWEYEPMHKDGKEYRSIVLTIQNTEGIKQDITIKQWIPIKLSNGAWVERFEESDCILPWSLNGINVLNGKASYESIYQVAYTSGTNIGLSHQLSNSKYGYAYTRSHSSIEDGAHVYCYLKSGSEVAGSPGGSTSEHYALPDQETFRLMKEYTDANPGAHVDPVKSYEDYWTSTVPQGKGTETVFWNAEKQSFDSTASRLAKKRVRAVFVGQY